jgi:hypothetical protein
VVVGLAFKRAIGLGCFEGGPEYQGKRFFHNYAGDWSDFAKLPIMR